MQAEMRQLDIKLSKALHMLDPEFSAERAAWRKECVLALRPIPYRNKTSGSQRRGINVHLQLINVPRIVFLLGPRTDSSMGPK